MGSSGSQKRLTKEFAEAQQEPPDGMRVVLENESIYNWNIAMEGPKGSPFEGGHFKMKLTMPTDYPFKPPQLIFVTKPYHPNVDQNNGAMCLGITRTDQWKPPTKIAQILQVVRQLIIEADLDDAVDNSIANQYKNNYKEYFKTAQDHTKRNFMK